MHFKTISLISIAIALTAPNALAEEVCSKAVCVETKRSNDGVIFFGINKKTYLPVSLSLRLTLKNMEVQSGGNKYAVLQPGERRRMFVLSPKDSRSAWRYSYKFKWNAGDYRAKHDDFRYALPFAAGRTYRVSQSCAGKASHWGVNAESIDFSMKVGTPVHAARGGKVVIAKGNSSRGGPSKKFINDANRVTILHSDKTLADLSSFQISGCYGQGGDDHQKGRSFGLIREHWVVFRPTPSFPSLQRHKNTYPQQSHKGDVCNFAGAHRLSQKRFAIDWQMIRYK